MQQPKYLTIVSEPTHDEVQRLCKSAGWTQGEYDKHLQEAYRRESVAMFDTLGYATKPNPEAIKGWGAIITILSEQIGYSTDEV